VTPEWRQNMNPIGPLLLVRSNIDLATVNS